MSKIENLMEHIIRKNRHLIVEKNDVTNVLKVINAHHKYTPDMAVGCCGWADSPTKWFIHFRTSNYKWRLIRNELKVIRVFENLDIPNDTIGVVYSAD